MSKAKARVFVPLTKVDEEQRLVYGRITQEILDKANEVMDYESSKPLFQKWSNDISEASGGLSKGNVRVMHGLTVAGKLTELDFNDEDLAIDVCSKIVDDNEWEKVTTGCYTGFSVGGSYAKRWTETDPTTGEKVKKFTAAPNEVSLVDNPCVPSATFSLFKADGVEEQIAFAVENDDEAWPDFAKVADEETTTEEVVEEQAPTAAVGDEPTNDAVVEKATQMAKDANDGTTWMSHVEKARDELMKAAPPKKEEVKREGDEEPPVEKVTPPGIKQVWTASDGKVFEKKADAEAHEETLTKAEPSDADKLKARLNKALNPVEEAEPGLMEDWDRLGKVVQALETPFENGAPKLEKGMYTVSRFANCLWDLGSLCRKIAKESVTEGDDASDKTVSNEMKDALAKLGDSFKTYVDNQITELLAGIDDDVCVEVYDYYYRAAQDNTEDQLAKDVCSVISDRRDPSRERRETLVKAFGIVGTLEVTEDTDELSPPMQKRFDELVEQNTELKKIAGEAVEAVEKLTKRVEDIEETPLPRAPNPRNIMMREGDGTFFGKVANTEEEKIAILHDMLKTVGPDGRT